MFNVHYENCQYKNNISVIDREEGLGFGIDYSNIRRVVDDHPERIQRVLSIHDINVTLEECVGLYHSWSTSRYAAGWMGTIDSMTDEDLSKVMSDWLVQVAADNIKRMAELSMAVNRSRR